jgi:hypothetical protein
MRNEYFMPARLSNGRATSELAEICDSASRFRHAGWPFRGQRDGDLTLSNVIEHEAEQAGTSNSLMRPHRRIFVGRAEASRLAR